MKKLNLGLLMALVLIFVTSCNKDNPTQNLEFAGVWLLEKIEYYDNGDYKAVDNPVKSILEFREDGSFRRHLYDDFDGKLSYSSDFYTWGYSEKTNTLRFWYDKNLVIKVNSSVLVLKRVSDNDTYAVSTYRKLSAKECSIYGIGMTSSGNSVLSGHIPNSLEGHQISLRMYDGTQYIDAYHVSSTKVTIGNHLIEYTENSPMYTYKVTSKNEAEYSLTFTKKVYVPYLGSYSYSFKHYEVTLKFSDSRSGTFSGTIYTGSLTNNPKNVEGIFTIDETKEESAKYDNSKGNNNGNASGGNDDDPDTDTGGNVIISELTISDITNITNNSANVKGTIIVEGKIEERGVVIVSGSVAAYALSLPKTADSFRKANYTTEKVYDNNFLVVFSGLTNSTNYYVAPYVIYGDNVKIGKTKSFKTK